MREMDGLRGRRFRKPFKRLQETKKLAQKLNTPRIPASTSTSTSTSPHLHQAEVRCILAALANLRLQYQPCPNRRSPTGFSPCPREHSLNPACLSALLWPYAHFCSGLQFCLRNEISALNSRSVDLSPRMACLGLPRLRPHQVLLHSESPSTEIPSSAVIPVDR